MAPVEDQPLTYSKALEGASLSRFARAPDADGAVAAADRDTRSALANPALGALAMTTIVVAGKCHIRHAHAAVAG